MPKDGLRPLPDEIVAPLLRALVTIRPTPENRLYLQRAEYGRAPGWDAATDYNVLYRGRAIGRIWRFIYVRDLAGLPVALEHAPGRKRDLG